MPKGKTDKKICNECKKEVSLFAFNRHYKSHFKAPIIRKKRVAWNKGLTSLTDIRVKNNSENIKSSIILNGGKKGIKHTEESKKLISIKALKSNHRRLVKSVRDYIKNDGTVVKLDSSWEEELAKRLDYLNIEWIRPNPIKWIDKNNTERNYFPDFYLPKYDMYLDPKNPAAYKQQNEKVTWLKNNVKNLKFLLTINEIKNYTPDSSME